MDDSESFASTLRRLRREKELSQIALAERVEVSGPTIWSWEKGKTRPSSLKIAALADALQVAESELIFEQPESKNTLHLEIERSKARVAALAGCGADQVKINIKW